MHILSEMILWCYFDRTSSSPRKLLWVPTWYAHIKASCSHTGYWDWAGHQQQQFWWEIISCQGEGLPLIWPQWPSHRSWIEKSPFLRGLAWALVSCTVGLTVSWTRDILSTGMDPVDLPGSNWRLVFVATILSSLVASDLRFCVFVSEAPGTVSHPDPICETGFHGNQLITVPHSWPEHDIQVQKLLRIWKPQQQSKAASAGSF